MLTIAVNSALRKYQVHAEVVESGTSYAESDAAKLQRRMERSLNRMERVAAVYLGQIYNRLTNGLQMAFDTAEAAVLGACEMQHRCAALPPQSGNSLTLRIGIHQGLELKRLTDDADSTIEIASLLAVVDDGIVVSGVVISALNPELRKFAHPLNDSPPPIAAHSFDWRREVPSTAYGGRSIWPVTKAFTQTGRWFVLRHNLKTIEFAHDKPIVTIGRDPRNDLVLAGNHVSRNHCRIDRRAEDIVLTDTSSNGTFVLPDQGEELRVARATVVLTGRGMIIFGRQFRGERRGSVMYDAFPDR